MSSIQLDRLSRITPAASASDPVRFGYGPNGGPMTYRGPGGPEPVPIVFSPPATTMFSASAQLRVSRGHIDNMQTVNSTTPTPIDFKIGNRTYRLQCILSP